MFPVQPAPVPLPFTPPGPRLPPMLLLAALAFAPPTRAADGFTEIGIDPPDPVPHAVRPALLDDEEATAPAPSDDAEWAAWWRKWRSWPPFAAQEPETPPSRDDGARLGGAAMPQATAPFLAFGNAVPLFIASMPARGSSTASTPTTTTTTTTGPSTGEEEETITLTETVPPSLLVEPPPIAPPPR